MILFYYLFLFVFLLLNQPHHIFGGDSAEFSLVARTFSVAHPPGYPFYSLLINIISRLTPFLNTPWSIAVISSLSTIVTSYLLYKLLRNFKCSTFSSILASTLYIFLFPVWLYSEIPEVFTLSNLLVLAITYLLFGFVKQYKFYLMQVIGFLFGICISHHHIFILFIPGWIHTLNTKKTISTLKKVTKKQVFVFVILLLIGTGFYLYAPIASILKPPLDWENPQTFSGFLRLVLRSTYGTFRAYSGSSGNILNQVFDILSLFIFILQDFRIIGIVILIIGFFHLKKTSKQLFNFLVITTLVHIFFIFYTNFSLAISFTIAMYERFLIPIYLLLIIPFAYGIEYILNITKSNILKTVHNHHLRVISINAVRIFFIMYVLIIFYQNYQTMKKIPRLSYFETYAKNLLDTPPKGSIFFVGNDNSFFPTSYLYFAQHYRNDIKYIFINMLDKDYYRKTIQEKYPKLIIPTNFVKGVSLNEFIEKNAQYGVFLDKPQSNAWKPYGLLWKYYASNEEAASDSANLVKENGYLWNHLYTIPNMDPDLKKILHLNVVYDNYIDMFVNYSKLLFATNNTSHAEMAIKTLLTKYKKNDVNTTMILVNLLVYQNKCEEGKSYIKLIGEKKMYDNPRLTSSFLEYYKRCDPNNPIFQRLKMIEDKNTKQKKYSLNGF